MTDWERLAAAQYCHLTTTGRVSGEPREIEIWFGGPVLDPEIRSRRTTIYLLGQGSPNWLRNLTADPAVSVRIEEAAFSGDARVVEDELEDALARKLLLEKYTAGYSGDLRDWGKTATPVAIDLEG